MIIILTVMMVSQVNNASKLFMFTLNLGSLLSVEAEA